MEKQDKIDIIQSIISKFERMTDKEHEAYLVSRNFRFTNYKEEDYISNDFEFSPIIKFELLDLQNKSAVFSADGNNTYKAENIFSYATAA